MKADIKTVPVQTAARFGGSPGAFTVGYYSVQDEVVVMLDQDGSPTGSVTLSLRARIHVKWRTD